MICRLLATRCCNLLQQHFLLLQQVCQRPLDGATVGDIFDGQENQSAGICLIEHLPGVQQHRALSEPNKVVLDLVVVHHGVLRQDFFQQHPKLRDVPLAVA